MAARAAIDLVPAARCLRPACRGRFRTGGCSAGGRAHRGCRCAIALLLDVHVVGVEVDEDVVGPDLLDHLHRLPAGVDQVRSRSGSPARSRGEARATSRAPPPPQRLCDVVVFALRRRQARALADAAVGHARQRLAAHRGGLVERELEEVDRAVGVDARPRRPPAGPASRPPASRAPPAPRANARHRRRRGSGARSRGNPRRRRRPSPPPARSLPGPMSSSTCSCERQILP